MAMWYDTIQDDKQLNTQLSQEMRKAAGDNRGFNNHFIRQILESIGYMERVQNRPTSPYDYGFSYGRQTTQIDPRQLDDNELNNIVSNIGEALFMTLVEHNPTYAKRLLSHGLHCAMDDELQRLGMREEKRMYQARWDGVDRMTEESQVVTPSRRPALVNDDYEYWCDWSENSSTIMVMSDYDGTPETGLVEFDFDPEEQSEIDTATREAEDTVRKLTTGELSLDDLVSRSKNLQSRSATGSTATEMQMKSEPAITAIEDAAIQFQTSINRKMLANLRDDVDKNFGILGNMSA